MSNFDDLRNTLNEDEESQSLDSFQSVVIEGDTPPKKSTRTTNRLLGMNPMERAFLAFMLFLNTLILGAGLLIATGRIVF